MAEGLVAAPGEAAAPRGRRSRALRVAFGGAGGVGAAIVAVVTLAAVFAPWVAPYDPVALNPPARLQGPSAENLLGTDQYGRDTLSRIVYGGRASLSVAGASTLFALLVGGALGVLAGFYRGWVDGLIMRVTDVLLSFPAILLAIALLAFLGPGFVNLVLAIGLVYVGPFARVARGAVMTVREELFVEASRSLGSRDWRVLLRAVLPAAAAPLIVEVTLRLAYGILAEASLSFLGLGLRPPVVSWGVLLQQAQNARTMAQQPWLLIPAVFVILTVLSFNFAGDGLRDAADPYAR